MKEKTQNLATALADDPELIRYALDRDVNADYWVQVVTTAMEITKLRGWLDGANYFHVDFKKKADRLEKLESGVINDAK